jgi:hypothetical protein
MLVRLRGMTINNMCQFVEAAPWHAIELEATALRFRQRPSWRPIGPGWPRRLLVFCTLRQYSPLRHSSLVIHLKEAARYFVESHIAALMYDDSVNLQASDCRRFPPSAQAAAALNLGSDKTLITNREVLVKFVEYTHVFAYVSVSCSANKLMTEAEATLNSSKRR